MRLSALAALRRDREHSGSAFNFPSGSVDTCPSGPADTSSTGPANIVHCTGAYLVLLAGV
jgi:hypothetical protein